MARLIRAHRAALVRLIWLAEAREVVARVERGEEETVTREQVKVELGL
ncbi:MAG: hypothetical protein LJE69_05745 [Thiohalocapsa sp.]|jgi:hypothetical protein|nr:hypothetical protein [Thiohalocapsa sp.]MCG6940736.1 hypothetical protein [Thiohalocapsa sp.]